MHIHLNSQNCSLVKTDGVEAAFQLESGRLRLDFAFGGSGYALVRIKLAEPLVLPANYAFKFAVKGNCPANTLEFKLLDASTDNVWWVNRPNFKFGPKYEKLVNKTRHFSYAWGPNKEPIKEVAYIDLTVTNTSGGKGTVYFSDLTFEERPAPEMVAPPRVKASSGRRSAADVLKHGDENAVWQTSRNEHQYLTFEFPQVRELSGLVVDWGDEHAVNYQAQIQGESGKWLNVDTIVGAGKVRQYLRLPDTDIKRLRLVLRRSAHGRGYQMRRVEFKELDWAPDMNAFWRRIAADRRGGFYPRYFDNEQSFWTVVGVSGGRQEAIINEEGMLELGRQTISVEPFIYDHTWGELLSWHGAHHEQRLLDGYLPVPQVTRLHEGLSLEVMAYAAGSQDDPTLYARYTLKNVSASPASGRFFLALRQFQVNPPWQFLNTPGGHTSLHCLSFARAASGESYAAAVKVDEKLRVVSFESTEFGATTLSCGDVVDYLARGVLPPSDGLCDIRGFGSGAFAYDYKLGPGEVKVVHIAVPYTGASQLVDPDAALTQVRSDWKALSDVGIDIPAAPELVDVVRSQLAYILVNRDGPAIQPGSRCYRRTWIRDGSLTSAALLQHGFVKEVRDFIEWFAPYQYPSGKVPCCVDKRGSDPVPEHDSHGEFIYLVMEYFRYTGDMNFLKRMFPRIVAAVGYIQELRKQTTDKVQGQVESQGSGHVQGQDHDQEHDHGPGPGQNKSQAVPAHLYGILPPSISHEGYSAHPAYSNWDNTFAMKGLDDAVEAALLIAAAQGEPLEKERAAIVLAELTAVRDDFHKCWLASIENSMKVHGIDFIPGANDLGDFDATSTTIGLDPAERLRELPVALANTFERYWQFFLKRRSSDKWFDYTPYEWRNVGALVRLGEVERAHEAFDYFMSFRRPRHWNHWAEVIYREPRLPRFIGDAPHGWVGSDFLRAVRNLFVYETRDNLVVAQGIRPEWLDAGVGVKLPTHGGELFYRARREGDNISLSIDGEPAAVLLSLAAAKLAFPGRELEVEVNGAVVETTDGFCRVALPAQVLIKGIVNK